MVAGQTRRLPGQSAAPELKSKEEPPCDGAPGIRYNQRCERAEIILPGRRPGPAGNPRPQDEASSEAGSAERFAAGDSFHAEEPARPAGSRAREPGSAALGRGEGPHGAQAGADSVAPARLQHPAGRGERGLNLASTAEDSPENVARNRERFLRKLGAPLPLVLLNQAHSAVIHRVYNARGPEWARLRVTRGKGILETGGDGLITDVRGVLLGIKVADCLPVILADRRRRAVGIFHAGWRGTAQRIVQKGVGEMRRQLGSRPADLVAVIGPGIGRCCYEIGEEVEAEFDSQFAYSKELFEDVFDSWSLKTKYPMLFLNQRAPGHGEPALSRHLDLVEANRRQLLDAGLPEENIEPLGLCTACRTDLFFSYRKEHVTGRMLAVVGIR
jgi:YfiH family protein